MQYSAVQCSTVQYCVVLYSRVRCSETQYNSVQYLVVLYSRVQLQAVWEGTPDTFALGMPRHSLTLESVAQFLLVNSFYFLS